MKKVLFKQDYDPMIERTPAHLEVIKYIQENEDIVTAIPLYVTVVIRYRGEHTATGRVVAVANNNLVIDNNPLPDSGAIRLSVDMFTRESMAWSLIHLPEGSYREYAHLAKSQDSILEVFMNREDMTNKAFSKTLTKE